jgi:hypothetical protein
MQERYSRTSAGLSNLTFLGLREYVCNQKRNILLSSEKFHDLHRLLRKKWGPDSQLHPDRLDPISSKSPQHCFTFVPYCLNHFFDEKGIIFGFHVFCTISAHKCRVLLLMPLIVVFHFQSHSRPSRGNPSSQAPDSPANQPSQTFNALDVPYSAAIIVIFRE